MPIERLNIALISDYFYPNKGGLETHIRAIGEELAKLGHHVIVITHKYDGFVGVFKLGNLIVYYLDLPVVVLNTTAPIIFGNYILFSKIFKKHNIQIVHGHQSLSNLCLEGIYHASNMNIKTVLTDHSIFEIAKFERILVNRICAYTCQKLDFVICVSEISKQNTRLRLNFSSSKMAVIPNGILPNIFYPKQMGFRPNTKIKLIFMSRFTFRKGIDLFIGAIPIICKNKHIEILIVGNGPKKTEIEQVISDNDLQEQVKLLEEVKYEDVGNILRSGDIFLNTSLTETFCLAILEAAACGLVVVTTNVGGIHEILPEKEIFYCSPTPDDIALQVNNAIKKLPSHNPSALFHLISLKYNWRIISKQIQDIYLNIPNKSSNNVHDERVLEEKSFLCRIATWYEFLQMKIFLFMEKLFER